MDDRKKEKQLASVIAGIEIVEAKLESPLAMTEVCATFDLSFWQSQRVFRALTGDTVNQYIRQRRLTHALTLLNARHLSIGEISLRLQFGSQEAFTRSFKDHFELTPSECRSGRDPKRSAIKPKLTKEKVAQISRHIAKVPVIQMIEARTYVGLSKTIRSPFGHETGSDAELLELWRHFNTERLMLTNRARGFSFGLTTGENLEIESKELSYIAGVRTANSLAAESLKFEMIEQSASSYAIFEVRGSARECHITTDFIYGIWLPQSGFQRGQGHDIDLYDHRLYDPARNDSISYRMVPLTSLTS